jgi:hypothetical protein
MTSDGKPEQYSIGAIHGGQNPVELVQMMQSLQHNIMNKIAISSDFSGNK